MPVDTLDINTEFDFMNNIIFINNVKNVYLISFKYILFVLNKLKELSHFHNIKKKYINAYNRL